MDPVQKWLKLYRSDNKLVRIRAAKGLLNLGSQVPLWVILSILDSQSDVGVAGSTERALLVRHDKELVSEMISRLKSSNEFIREVACKVLGGLGDRTATSPLLGMLEDPYLMVRRTAAFSLASISDPTAIPELRKQYTLQRPIQIWNWRLVQP